MTNQYLAELFSQNVGKMAYIESHRSDLSNDDSTVEGVIESCDGKELKNNG